MELTQLQISEIISNYTGSSELFRTLPLFHAVSAIEGVWQRGRLLPCLH